MKYFPFFKRILLNRFSLQVVCENPVFYYRGNGSIDVISDKEFSLEKYKDRNVVIYGKASNNKAWNLLLKNSYIQIDNQQVKVGDKVLKGNDLATYFVFPRKDSKTAIVGVVAGTSEAGMKATWANNYISGITGFPDVMIFKADLLLKGLPEMKISLDSLIMTGQPKHFNF